jgi:hypothetical protein
MKRTLFIFSLLSVVALAAFSQENYSILFLPKPLTKNASVVKRMEEVFIHIKDIGKATITTKYAITILNPAGDEAANFMRYYSKLESIKSIDGNLYDAFGKKLRSLKKGEVKDYGGTDDSNFADDSRVKQHNFNYNSYPYTVEYEVEEQLKGVFGFPRWMPVRGIHYSVQESKLVVRCPKDYQLRYKSFNYNGNPSVTTEKDQVQYEWVVKEIPAIDDDNFIPSWFRITPAVLLAPTAFEIQDYKGTMNDWQGFGKFIHELNKGRDVLPENIRNQIHDITNSLPDAGAKVRAAYEYLQRNTHYISVQLGIGGWQTFDAKYVAEKGYGDCKALSNYMYSLLKEIGIKSYYTLIQHNKDENNFEPDFPSNQFNHIIVCVPVEKDTIWLECTSQTVPAGYLSSYTSNRPALLIDETGGKIVYTPRYDKKVNTQLRRLAGSISEEGKLTLNVTTHYQAWQQERLHGLINGLSKEKVHEILKQELELPTYDVEKFEYRENKSQIPSILEMLQLTSNNYATKTGKRLFIIPNVMTRYSSQFESKERGVDIQVINGYTDIDSVEISLPSGYKPESIPSDNDFQSAFGKYRSSIQYKPGKLIYYRLMERNDGIYPAKDYKEMVAFYNNIYKADRARVVLVKDE